MSEQLLFAQSATVTAMLPYFGSKRTLAPRIVEQLGPHSCYWEPFCGSLAVVFAKPQATMETVNDLFGDVVNLARILANEEAADALYRRLQTTLMSEDVFNDAAAAVRSRGWIEAGEHIDVARAYEFFLCSWLGRNGVTGTHSYNQGFCVRYTKNGGHGAKRFVSAVESIPAWHQRLRGVTILNRNAIEILDRVDDAKGTVIYLNPPYVDKGATYIFDAEPAGTLAGDAAGTASIQTSRATAKASKQYTRRTMTHQQLAEKVRRFKHSRVVISYYDHPLVRELYHGWTFVSVPTTKALVNQGARMLARKGEPEKAPELLIINGPQIGGAT
jgi:DNA adenine methylase